MAWVVEMSGYDKVAAQEKTVRFAMGQGIAFSDAYAPGALQRWLSASQRIEISASGAVQTTGDTGELTIANFPDDVWEMGPWDALADWVWQNRQVSLFWAPGAWADRQLVQFGTLEQPVATLDVSGNSSLGSVLRFPIRDPRAALETPLQPVKFAGTNVGPNGVEGGEDLKGRPKPIVYGLVSNFSPPRVNSSLLIYQLADAQVTIVCVRDGAVPIFPSTVRASLVSLQANTPPGGTYDVYKGAEGTFIRLGTTPIFNLTCDADEAANEASQSHPYIWARLRGRVTPTVALAGADAAQAIDSAGAGFYWDEEITQREALDEVLSSFSGYEYQRLDGVWVIEKLVIPSGTSAIDLVQLSPSTRMKAKSRPIQRLTRVRPDYAKNGAPPYRVNVQWGRNYTVMQPNAFAGAAIARLRDKFSLEFRTVTAKDDSIWNPVNQTGPWTNAPDLTVQTAYQPGTGGEASPGAQAEADRILALLGPIRGQFQITYQPAIGDDVHAGSVVGMTYPRMGLAGGAVFRVLEEGYRVEGGLATADIVIGLQA